MDIFVKTLKRLYEKDVIKKDKIKEYKKVNKITESEYEYITLEK